MGFIWIMSSIPAKEMPQINIFGSDKIAHFGIYFVWGTLGKLYARSRDSRKAEAFLVLALMIALAALDEYHQYFIPGRSVSVYDLLANWSGILAAWIITSRVSGRRSS
jgi:VanZ family protein